MRWYMGTFVIHSEKEVSTRVYRAREELCLLIAEDSNSAYARALEIAKRTATEAAVSEGAGWTVDGIIELLMLIEDPRPGSELAWTEEELLPDELRRSVKSKGDLTVFRHSRLVSGSEWFMGTIVLAEVHDTGSHGDSVLVWTNSYLVNAKDPESAFKRCAEIGQEIESDAGPHRCDGDIAHWRFVGLADLAQTLAAPSDGAILRSREFIAAADELMTLIPPRSELGVFEWEGERSVRR